MFLTFSWECLVCSHIWGISGDLTLLENTCLLDAEPVLHSIDRKVRKEQKSFDYFIFKNDEKFAIGVPQYNIIRAFKTVK